MFDPTHVRRGGRFDSGEDAGLGSDGTPEVDDLLMRLRAVLQPSLAAFTDPEGVLEWPHVLHAYQRDGIGELISRESLLLADDMGLGKTIQAIGALRILLHREELKRALVACPASLLIQWSREFRLWAPELVVVQVAGTASARGARWKVPAHVRLIGYETLRGDVLDLRDSPALRDTWDVVVLDEAAKIKNRESGASIACKKLPRVRSWALTGTPIENRLDDLLSIADFVGQGRGPKLGWAPSHAVVREWLAANQVRRRKDDVLTDLPPKQVNEVEIDLLPAQREAYDRAETDGVVQLKRHGAAVTITHVLELISRLKQLCNSDPVSGDSAKLDDINERMDVLTAQGHRALIFSQFTDPEFGVARAMTALAAHKPMSYTGTMSQGEKARAVEEFFGDTTRKALILSLRAGGMGLNLQAASFVFHLDRWWNPAIEDQAESRSHRMGQHYPVTVYRYTCRRTIEERIHNLLSEKRALFTEIIDDETLDLGKALSERELFNLFGMAAPTRTSSADSSAERDVTYPGGRE